MSEHSYSEPDYPRWVERVTTALRQAGSTEDPAKVAAELTRNKFFISRWSPEQAATDAELAAEIARLPSSKAVRAEAEQAMRVHPINSAALASGVPAGLLARLGGLEFNKVSASQRIAFVREFEASGHPLGAAAAAKEKAGPAANPVQIRRGVEDLDSVKLPAAVQRMQGASKIEAVRAVAAANRARTELAALEKAGTGHSEFARRLRETIILGHGGSPA